MKEMSNTQLLVRRILMNWDRCEWSLQGFGMLRTYLSKEVRMHIWHSGYAVPNVSTIHDHPWDFESEVVCGEIENRIYAERVEYASLPATHIAGRIRCGVGGGLVRTEHGASSEREVRLRIQSIRRTGPGQSYSERAEDLHESVPKDGTVTIVRRKFRSDTEHATVCYPIGTQWVSAEPRPATNEEIEFFTSSALSLMDCENK